jgi:hypothetical protein
VRDRISSSVWPAALALLTLALLAGDALAYAGPADPALLSSFFTLLGWLAVALSAVFLWPLYALRQWLRRGRAVPAPAEDQVAG